MNFQEYSTENDLVSKFSHFENLDVSSSKTDLLDYLTENHQGPLSKSDLQEYARN
jgi:DNA-binding winged helix-turn-helix (wHTH) protein